MSAASESNTARAQAMTREERAEVTIRVAGIFFLTWTLGGLVLLVQLLHEWHLYNSIFPEALRENIRFLFVTAAGYYFFFRPRGIALLLRPQREEADTGEEELLRAGVFLHGVLFAFTFCEALLWGAGTRQAIFGMCFLGLTTAVFLAGPPPLIAWLARRARAGAGESGVAKLLGAGICLIALPVLAWNLGQGLSTAFAVPEPHLVEVAAPSRAYVVAGVGLALSLLALGLCGRIGCWLAGQTPAASRQQGEPLGMRDWAVLAVICIPLYWVLRGTLWPAQYGHMGLPAPIEGWTGPLVLLGLPVLAALMARRIARRLYPEEPDRPGSRARLLLSLETAVTVPTLYLVLHAIRHATSWGTSSVWHLAPMLLLLVCRGDVAWWCARPTAAPDDAKAARAARLAPWLGLLGAYLLIHYLPALVGLAAVSVGWVKFGPGLPVGHPVPAELWLDPTVLPPAGLALVLAARPLARALSYGPVLHLLWRWWRAVGWKQRPTD